MKANELMVGNFAWADGSNVLIREIGEKQTCVSWDDERPERKYLSSNLIPNDWIRPIPITEEFLVKNGFKREYDCICEFHYYICEVDGYFVEIKIGCSNMGDEYVNCHIDNCDRSSVANADIRYLHQLQNLLNIMNIEFNIEL